MMRPQLVTMAIVVVMAALCASSTGSVVEVPEATQATPSPPSPHNRKIQTRSRGNSFRGLAITTTTSPPKSENCHQLMTSLNNRVSLLATLDGDQRHRLEVIDKKLDQLEDSGTARIESIKAQQLDFNSRLDSIEQVQNLSRETLNYIKEHSRPTRGVSDPILDERLDALATLLTSTALSVRSVQIEVANLSRVIRRQNHFLQRTSHGPSAVQPPIFYGPSALDGVHPNYPTMPTGCEYSNLAAPGILKVKLTPDSESFYVSCEQDWTVILRRSSDDVNFERGWLDYREGFGNLAADFFIGLNKLHALTSSTLHELRIVMEDFAGNEVDANYASFAIGSESELYPLTILGKYQENLTNSAGDSLSYHAGAKFSTVDSDNDNCLECNCAMKHRGAGWYSNCATSNSFGKYIPQDQNYAEAGDTGMWWDTFRGAKYSLKKVRWMIRPVADGSDALRR
ncbi:fibrinogen C domain-containing protein 1 [Drosophila elegans]|uniref:fibrinogen C domain-containing protein 1 n=1 Tax=Drosophila elegans TaxID=30023 RepID=UPI0007E68FE1|nr:fibrinogen C domain-containing protein 1 [Drosophila elegans]